MSENQTAATVAAFLIDPHARTVTEVQTTGRTEGPAGLYELLGCAYVERVECGHGFSVWLDEEGMLKPWEDQAFCLTPFYPEPLAGKLLLMRERVDGEDYRAVNHGLKPGFADWLAIAVRWIAPKAVEVPAPVFMTQEADGSITAESLGGDSRGMWTINHQP
ncbi:hypothetical protein DEH84_06940 [Aquabacterium olei]|uniref:Uncharacterized protein n=1 Tax=Aquabacterium olei TaxID=1296669 RepID=A0A2U8FQ70_9BURK|nr:hypothetical protein [Aquabacterium olei]AWI53195.1 hypothetical protein DEH84_06940 [Aquabacterium olei]